MQALPQPNTPSLIAAAALAAPVEVKATAGARGFSLIELLIAIAVAAILVSIAVPSFKNILLSNRLTTAANDIVGAIHAARMEAIKLNGNTQLCSNSASSNSGDALGTKCTSQTGAVWAMIGTTPTQIREGAVGLSTPLQLHGDMAALRFSSSGLAQKVGITPLAPYNDIVVDICTSAISSNNHRVISMAAGSIVTVSPGSGACL